MSILSTPTLPNTSNLLSGISSQINSAVNIKSVVPNKTEPLKNVAGLPYKKPIIDCSTFPLKSLDKLPCPDLPALPKPGLPSKQELVNRITQFIPNASNLSVPGLPSVPAVPTSNLPKLDISKLNLKPCPAVPTLSALNPFPGYAAQVKLWLNEPITLPKIKDLLPNLPTIPKPPYFTLPCNLTAPKVSVPKITT